MKNQIKFTQTNEGHILFKNYPFRPSIVFSNQEVKVSEIEEVYLDTYPLSLRIKNDLVFVSRTQLAELTAFTEQNQLKVAQRANNWSWLSEPFLDTVFDEKDQQKTIAILEGQGFSKVEINDIRNQIAKPLLRYNAIMWEWVDLGLFDVLQAMKLALRRKAFESFYWKAIEIETRTKPSF